MTFDWNRLLPQFWLQNYPTDWEWDATLNRLLDEHPAIKPAGNYTVLVGGVEVWAANYPYAYGRPYTPKMDALPSVATRKRLHSLVKDCQRKAFNAAVAKAEALSQRTEEAGE